MDAELRQFKDQTGRSIELRFELGVFEVHAFDGDRKVGWLALREDENDEEVWHTLIYPEVASDYRHAGIAAAMLKFAYEYLDNGPIVVGGPADRGISGENARTPEGEAFVQFGIAKGWLVDQDQEEFDRDEEF